MNVYTKEYLKKFEVREKVVETLSEAKMWREVFKGKGFKASYRSFFGERNYFYVVTGYKERGSK